MRYLLSFLLFIIFGASTIAQENCALTLENAQKLYDNGMIEEIPNVLAPCMKSGFNSDERLQAYKLIILSHIFNNNMNEADKNMLMFLKKYPEYELSASDPAEFVQLFNTYRTNPFASISLKGGSHINNIKVLQVLRNKPGSTGNFYTSSTSFQGGMFFEYNIYNNFFGGTGGNYIFSQWKYTEANYNDTRNDVTIDEAETSMGVPLYVMYKFAKLSKLEFLACTGYELQYLLSSTHNIETIEQPSGSKNLLPEFSIIDVRKKLNHNYYLSLITDRKLPRSAFRVEIGYLYGRSNNKLDYKEYIKILESTTTNDIKEEENKIGQQPDFSVNRLFINIGFTYKFYKPEKK